MYCLGRCMCTEYTGVAGCHGCGGLLPVRPADGKGAHIQHGCVGDACK